MLKLTVQSESQRGEKLTLASGQATFGRASDNDFILNDFRASRKHMQVAVRDGHYYINDLGSANGTFLNGTLLKAETQLHHGDTICCGSTDILAEIDAAEATQPAAGKARCTPVPSVKVLADADATMSVIKKLDLAQQLKADAEKKDRLATIYQVSETIGSVLNLDILLERLLQIISKVMVVERGAILLKETGSDNLVPRTCFDRGTVSGGGGQDLVISQSIARQVLDSGAGALISDASADPRFMGQQSIVNMNIRSALCVPLAARGQKLGIIYLDSSMKSGSFTEGDLSLLSAIAAQAALFLDNVRLFETLQREEQHKQNLERFLSPPVVREILASKGSLALGGTRREATIMFADIRNFAALTARLKPEKLVAVLNEYFTAMTAIIFKFEGTLDKFIGDAVMAEFGIPIAHQDDPLRAINAALEMRKRLAILKKKWMPENIKKFDIGIGINTGKVIAGNIGSNIRMQYTVVGDAVNIASRISNKAKPNQILISEDTWKKLGPNIKTNKLLPIMMKGYSTGIQVYEVLD